VFTFVVAETCSARKAWLLSGSSQERTALGIVWKALVYQSIAFRVSGESIVTAVPSAENSAPPKAQRTG